MTERGANKTADAIIISQSPDVCDTPRGSKIVAVPYPIYAKFDSAQDTSINVNFQGNAAFNFASYLPKVTGNEAGVKGGVMSGVNKGIVNPSAKSSSVRINGEWAIRNAHQMEMNCSAPKTKGNTTGKVTYLHIEELARVNEETREIQEPLKEEYQQGAEGIYYMD